MAINNILTVDYSEEMKKSFIDYSMSVIVSRAIPDVRDGLKPVHRRILYTLYSLGLTPQKPYSKAARMVGDCMGKFHPHGDSSIYDAAVRLAQEFSTNHPLIDGHGNFGSIDGDSAAAMRYTELRMSNVASYMLTDIDKNTVDFQFNYDDKLKEPVVLPAQFPNLLVNGTDGIAVGMATYIPPHNLDEVIRGIMAYMDNPAMTVKELMKYIKAPDFPSGGIITNESELKNLYESGNGKIKVRGKVEIEDAKYGKTNIIIREIPYSMTGNKTKFIQNLISDIRDRKFDEITDVRDESSKEGIKIIIEIKKDVNTQNFINKLYKKTKLEDTIGVNLLALVNKKPEILSLKDIIRHYVDYQHEFNTRKFNYILNKSNERKEELEGLIKAQDILDVIIEVLRGSEDDATAKRCLMHGDTTGIQFKTKAAAKEAMKFDFTELQTDAILEIRLRRLIRLELKKLQADYESLMKDIAYYELVLQDEKEMNKVIKGYLTEIKKKFAIPRKTQITQAGETKFVEEIREEELYILIDRFGYVKTVDANSFTRANEETQKEFKHVLNGMNTDKLCIFTESGNLYQVKLMDMPKVKIKDKGVPLDSLAKMGKEEIIKLMLFNQVNGSTLVFTTEQGLMKAVPGSEFETNRTQIAGSKLDEGDKLISINILPQSEGGETRNPNDEPPLLHVAMVSQKGYVLKFIYDIPLLKKTSKGVKTIRLDKGDALTTSYLMTPDEAKEITVNGKPVDLKGMRLKKRNQAGVLK